MLQLLGIIIIIILLILFINKTNETFLDYASLRNDLWSDLSGTSNCPPLDNFKTQRTTDPNYRVACSTATNIIGLSDTCKKNYCMAIIIQIIYSFFNFKIRFCIFIISFSLCTNCTINIKTKYFFFIFHDFLDIEFIMYNWLNAKFFSC